MNHFDTLNALIFSRPSARAEIDSMPLVFLKPSARAEIDSMQNIFVDAFSFLLKLLVKLNSNHSRKSVVALIFLEPLARLYV